MLYIVKPEFIDNYSSNSGFANNPFITESELKRLARDWDVSVADLENQVSEMDTTEAQEIIDNGLFPAAVELMDDDIREQIHASLAPCSDLDFMAAYMAAHEKKYGVEFKI